MGVVGRADGHGVDLVAELLEHLAVVVELLRLGILLAHLVEHVAVDVAEGDDLAVLAGVIGIAIALAADADAREADLLIGRRVERTGKGRGAAKRNVPVPATAVCLKNSRRSMVRSSREWGRSQRRRSRGGLLVLEGGLTEPVRPLEEVSPTFSQHDSTPPSWQPVWRANNRPTSAWISARCTVLPFFCRFSAARAP